MCKCVLCAVCECVSKFSFSYSEWASILSSTFSLNWGTLILQPQTRSCAASATCVFFCFLFVVCYALSYIFVETFSKKLSRKGRVNWSLVLIRGMFGVVATSAAVWYTFFDDLLRKDVVNANNITTFVIFNITLGFYTFECLTLFPSYICFGFL